MKNKRFGMLGIFALVFSMLFCLAFVSANPSVYIVPEKIEVVVGEQSYFDVYINSDGHDIWGIDNDLIYSNGDVGVLSGIVYYDLFWNSQPLMYDDVDGISVNRIAFDDWFYGVNSNDKSYRVNFIAQNEGSTSVGFGYSELIDADTGGKYCNTRTCGYNLDVVGATINVVPAVEPLTQEQCALFDVDLNGSVDLGDEMILGEKINGSVVFYPLHFFDLDGNGGAEPSDMSVLINWLNGIDNIYCNSNDSTKCDIDRNGGAEPSDMSMLINTLNGIGVVYPEKYFDVNNDSVVNLTDADEMHKYLTGGYPECLGGDKSSEEKSEVVMKTDLNLETEDKGIVVDGVEYNSLYDYAVAMKNAEKVEIKETKKVNDKTNVSKEKLTLTKTLNEKQSLESNSDVKLVSLNLNNSPRNIGFFENIFSFFKRFFY